MSKHSHDCTEDHDTINAVPPTNDAEEKQDAEKDLHPSSGWSEDPKNAVNWSSTRKWTIVILLWATVTVTFASPPLNSWFRIYC